MATASLLLASTAPSASAQDQPDPVPELAIETAGGQATTAFHVQLEPGESETVELRFSVEAESAVNVSTYIADAIAPPNGGFGLGPAGEPEQEHTAWLEFDAQSFTLNPDAPVGAELSVDVPANAEPGQYVAALAIQTTGSFPIPGNSGIGQTIRAVAAVTIAVPGDFEPEFDLGEPTLVQQPAGASIQIPIDNTGNIPVYPQGTLTLESPNGDNAASIPVTMGAVFAGGNTFLDVTLTNPPPPGDYLLALDLTDPDSGATAEIDGAPLVVPELATAPVEEESSALVTLEEIAIEPESGATDSVLVSFKIANVGPPVTGATVTLEVSRDGQIVETTVVAQQLVLVDGVTTFSTSYAPDAGFGSGGWTFRIRLDAVDADGVVTLIAQSGIVRELDVP